ncbi:hypothetical protein LTS18_001468, partial [Coniosporium uncinatum]
MVAESATALLISVHDGAIIRLHKDSDDRWDKTYYREGGWKKTIRGFVPFQSHQTELFNGMELELSSAIDMAPSPDGQHIWSVGMNHTLRSRTKGEDYGGAELDLVAGHVRNLHTATQPRIPPTQSQLLQILNVQGSYDSDRYGYHVVTFSPAHHRFKFWAVRDAADSTRGIRDVHDDISFVPPIDELMDISVWTLDGFHVKANDWFD